MAEESDPDEPSNAPDEEGSDRSPDDGAPGTDESSPETSTDDGTGDAEDSDSSEETNSADETPSHDERSDSETPTGSSTPTEPDDETDETGSASPEPIVDPLGKSAPRPHEWLGGDGETDVVTDPDGEIETHDDETEDAEGLTRVDDGDETSTPPDGSRPEAPPPGRTRSGHPDATPESPEQEAAASESPPEPELENDFIGPLPPGEVEEVEEGEEDTESDAPREEFIDQYKTQEELIEGSGDQQLLEPDVEPTIEESRTGGVLGRDREGPPDDQEMPLTEHIEEMVKRLGIVVVIAAVVTILAWPFSEGATLHIWQAVLPTADAPDPHLYGPLEKILTQIKVAGLAGLLIALPMVVYQTYRFMRPGLYPHERRYYLAAVPTSLVLAALGMAFSYFIVLPALFVYFMYYTEDSVDIVAFGLSKTFTLIVTLTGVLAIVFQIPLFIMLAIMMGVTSRRWLASKRIYFWAAFAGVSFLIAPDPTGMAPFLVAGTAIGLFEGTLFLLKWVKRGRQRYRRSREDED